TIENEKQSIKMKIDSDVIYVNNEKNTISKDSIPKFATYLKPKYETKTMVPLRFLSETFGYSVSWDQSSQTAIVNTSKNAEPIVEPVKEENTGQKAGALTINETKNGIIVKPKNTDGFRSENELKQMSELDKKEKLVEPQKKRNISKTLKTKGKVTIVLDAGHGGKDSGGLSKDGYMEKVPTLKVAKRLSEKLKDKGYEVIMTRNSDVYIELLDRAGISNDSEAELFLSIHFNCSANSGAKGIETFYASEKTVGIKSVEQKPFAQQIQKAVISVTGANNRGAKDGSSYLVLNKTNTVAALVELGFLSNEEELEKIKDDEYIDKLVEGVYQGINNYVDKYVEK
ncbi:N-acetylmuramoyl-L-alanine amidase, partial [Peptoniphilus asaccharolyticus]